MPSRTSAKAHEPPDQDLTTVASKAKPKASAKAKKASLQAETPSGVVGKPTITKAAAKAVAVARKTSPADKAANDVAGTGPAVEIKTSATTLASKTAANRNVAAAFVAARQKMAPPTKTPPSEQNNIVAAKGTVEVSDKKRIKAVDEERVVENAAAEPTVQQSEIQTEAGSAARTAPRPTAPVLANGGAKVAKPVAPKGQGFKTQEYIVYPAHGVGQIVAIEEQVVAGYKLELFVISFIKDKMILKVPLPKITSVGMRKLAEAPVVKRALDTLMGRARVKRTMWSRRAQEYEAKINSGDLVAIAEVVRDLYRSDAQPEQSYSERQLYEAALDRMAREIAVVQKLTDSEALKLIDDQLQKGPRRTKADEVEAEEGEEADDTAGVGEAA